MKMISKVFLFAVLVFGFYLPVDASASTGEMDEQLEKDGSPFMNQQNTPFADWWLTMYEYEMSEGVFEMEAPMGLGKLIVEVDELVPNMFQFNVEYQTTSINQFAHVADMNFTSTIFNHGDGIEILSLNQRSFTMHDGFHFLSGSERYRVEEAPPIYLNQMAYDLSYIDLQGNMRMATLIMSPYANNDGDAGWKAYYQVSMPY
ncbi:hypothetical protein [Jeotgalibacillus marinus]|uniref:Uncharacterized protein n=1 Tax=Jeotgalibacillus marinus TaxID=86667 RepID=A0ABV3Q463_9BACL